MLYLIECSNFAGCLLAFASVGWPNQREQLFSKYISYISIPLPPDDLRPYAPHFLVQHLGGEKVSGDRGTGGRSRESIRKHMTHKLMGMREVGERGREKYLLIIDG